MTQHQRRAHLAIRPDRQPDDDLGIPIHEPDRAFVDLLRPAGPGPSLRANARPGCGARPRVDDDAGIADRGHVRQPARGVVPQVAQVTGAAQLLRGARPEAQHVAPAGVGHPDPIAIRPQAHWLIQVGIRALPWQVGAASVAT